MVDDSKLSRSTMRPQEEMKVVSDGDDKLSPPPTPFKRFLNATVLKKKWTRIDILTSMCLYIHVLPWGLYCGALSTTLLDLEQLTHSSTAQIGLMFTATTFGALVGAPAGGLILSKVDCRAFLGVVCFLYGCTTTALPWSGNFMTLIIVSSLHGVLQGALDSGQNVTALLIWGWDGSVFLQAFHTVFAIGTFIGPFITKPFLAPTWYEKVNGSAPANFSNGLNQTSDLIEKLVVGTSRAHIPFLIIGLIMISSGILYFVIFFITRKEGKNDVRSERNAPNKDDKRNPNQGKSWYMVTMAILAFIRFGMYVGIELTFSGFLMTFTVKALGWEKTAGLTATTIYWGSFAASRILSVFLVTVLSPTIMVVSDITLMLSAYITLSIFVTYHPMVIKVCSVVAGLAGGSFYGCSMSWAYKYIKVSERVGTVFTSGAWAGMAAIPALAGYLIDSVTPLSFVYMCLSIVVILSVSTLSATVIGLRFGAELPGKQSTSKNAVADEPKELEKFLDRQPRNDRTPKVH